MFILGSFSFVAQSYCGELVSESPWVRPTESIQMIIVLAAQYSYCMVLYIVCQ